MNLLGGIKMNTIHNYVESMFLNVPSTPEMMQLKEDILSNMEDKYVELIAEGKSENETIGIVISEFGNIDEILEEFDMRTMQGEADKEVEEKPTLPVVDMEEATRYMEAKRKVGLLVGLGIIFCLFGIAVATLSIRESFLRGFPEVWKIVVLLICVAIGVCLFVYAGVQISPFEYMEGKFILKTSARSEIERRKQAYRPSFGLSTAFGVALCILAIIPILFAQLSNSYLLRSMGISLALIIVGAGIFLFCYGGNVQSSYTILLENGLKRQPTEKEIKENRSIKMFNSIYWPLLTVVYLLWGFLGHNWELNWIVYVIGGIIGGIIQSLLGKKEKE